MTSKRWPVLIVSFALGAPLAVIAQGTTPMAADAAKPAAPASAAKVKKPPRARVTGGPGYVSESATASAAASGTTPGRRTRARVTGGPGGTGPGPSTGK